MIKQIILDTLLHHKQFTFLTVLTRHNALLCTLVVLLNLTACSSSSPTTANIHVAPASELTTSESGGTAFFNVVLDTRPTTTVNISLQSSDETEGKLTNTTLTYTPDNWSTPQSVTVTGVDDTAIDGNINYRIKLLPAVSADANYDGLDATDVMLTNLDDDTPATTPPDLSPSPNPDVDHTLYISEGSITITASDISGNGAASLPILGYSTESGAAGTSPGPLIESHVGNPISILVVNNDAAEHEFEVQGLLSAATALIPGESRQFQFTPTKAGIYLYGDPDMVHRSRGLFGAIVVRPADDSNTAWRGGPSFSQQRNWVITDLDETWNRNPAAVDVDRYNPNYFLINGKNGFAAKKDRATTLEGKVGETLLVRIANAGQYDQSLHFHASHFKVISQNGIDVADLNDAPSITTINVKRGSTAMVLYTLTQAGTFPVHVHTAHMETGNGVYLNGTATFIIAK